MIHRHATSRIQPARLNGITPQDIVLLIRDSVKNRKSLATFRGAAGLEIHWGDLNDYDAVLECVRDADLILHIAALVSPAADYHPELAMKVNYGSTRNLIRAMKNLCAFNRDGTLEEGFWGHIYNIGGGESCRGSPCCFREIKLAKTAQRDYYKIRKKERRGPL